MVDRYDFEAKEEPEVPLAPEATAGETALRLAPHAPYGCFLDHCFAPCLQALALCGRVKLQGLEHVSGAREQQKTQRM